MKPDALKTPCLVAGFGEPEEEFSRYLALDSNQFSLRIGQDNVLTGTAALAPGKWHFVAATFDGEQFRLYTDGTQVASGKLDLGSVSPVLEMAPPTAASSMIVTSGAQSLLSLCCGVL